MPGATRSLNIGIWSMLTAPPDQRLTAGHDAEPPMREHSGVTLPHGFQPRPGTLPGMFQALEFPPGPTHEICVETTKGGIQGGLVESPVVGDPARHMHGSYSAGAAVADEAGVT